MNTLSLPTIKEVLASLSAKDRRQLMYAFNQEIAQYIPLPDEYFIGVHVDPLVNLEILTRAGAWAYGRLK